MDKTKALAAIAALTHAAEGCGRGIEGNDFGIAEVYADDIRRAARKIAAEIEAWANARADARKVAT
jgi:hypothetical protein